MANPIYVLLLVVSLSVLVLLAINLYILVKSRKKGPDSDYLLMHQRLDAISTTVNDQLERSRQSVEKTTFNINDQLEKNRQASEKATLVVSQQVQGFTQGMTQLHEMQKQMHESVKGISSFQDIMKAPKLRGTWGELSLESLLREYYPQSMYAMQHEFKSGEKVDAVLKLPNSKLFPIDSKFSWENFQKMVSANNDIDREIHKKSFIKDVKARIDEISKYILPSENTVDWAAMYVPAETVFYEMINNIEADIAAYGRSRKVMIMSPNTFYITLNAVMQWTKNIEFNKQADEIIKRLAKISQDGDKLSEEFRLLGKHLSNANSSFRDSEDRMSKLVTKVKNVVEIGERDEPEQIQTPLV